MAPDKYRDNEIYKEGVKAGQKADPLDQIVHGWIPAHWDKRENEIHNKGFDYGLAHKPEPKGEMPVSSRGLSSGSLSGKTDGEEIWAIIFGALFLAVIIIAVIVFISMMGLMYGTIAGVTMLWQEYTYTVPPSASFGALGLEGEAQCKIDFYGKKAAIKVDQIRSTSWGGHSGSLGLVLWADECCINENDGPISAFEVASWDLNDLSSGECYSDIEKEADLKSLDNFQIGKKYYFTLTLNEYNGNRSPAIEWVNFKEPYIYKVPPKKPWWKFWTSEDDKVFLFNSRAVSSGADQAQSPTQMATPSVTTLTNKDIVNNPEEPAKLQENELLDAKGAADENAKRADLPKPRIVVPKTVQTSPPQLIVPKTGQTSPPKLVVPKTGQSAQQAEANTVVKGYIRNIRLEGIPRGRGNDRLFVFVDFEVSANTEVDGTIQANFYLYQGQNQWRPCGVYALERYSSEQAATSRYNGFPLSVPMFRLSLHHGNNLVKAVVTLRTSGRNNGGPSRELDVQSSEITITNGYR